MNRQLAGIIVFALALVIQRAAAIEQRGIPAQEPQKQAEEFRSVMAKALLERKQLQVEIARAEIAGLDAVIEFDMLNKHFERLNARQRLNGSDLLFYENPIIIPPCPEYPAKLEELIKGDKPILHGGQNQITDPWGKQYQYDPKGPKNKGKKPDIWTETPDKKIIGNWPEDKK